MRRKKPKGLTIFVIIYNLIGLIGLEACFYGFMAISQSENLVIGDKDYTQMIAIVLTVLFFLSSFLLLEQKKWGYLIPVFLLTFFIMGGFVVLLPLFVIHLAFFTHPPINECFI